MTRANEKGRKAPVFRVGTSGWHYADWWGPFFPGDLPKKRALPFYAAHFNAAELNLPFYRTPTPAAVEGWHRDSPDDFRFAWKASKFITHWKRLSARSQNSLDLMEERLALLCEKVGPVLFQLPPRMKVDHARLEDFTAMLRTSRRYVFEFRHSSWYDDKIFELLRARDIALCISDHADAPAPWEQTASVVYIRGHGPSGRYHGSYSDETLSAWARDMRRWQRAGREVWCLFDNDVKSAAPHDAQRLQKILRR